MRNSGEGQDRSRNVARHELIGLEVEVRSAHAGWDGLTGRVVDETKHTLVVERASGSEATVPKQGQSFVFRVGDGVVVVQGDDIRFQPEDRTKKFKIKR
jgi:ribonuclease P protein subunit POP4